MSPQVIIEKVNRRFPDAIVATDVGQHQMCRVFDITIIGYEKDSLILESVHTESRNDEIIKLI
ncbi:hypothetical protein [Terrisporobacter mayombei]|uniref:hypothetical protein n=1 Tax=Terrisporobacter mayombei TaxID=1541 RepID=UPI001D1686AC|nr:hypothetical protein [Terrisporobacter mayombei]MCC3867444.1 hypothetical protein [Terrisporobacter mayombei]